jgi:hypothetical protein
MSLVSVVCSQVEVSAGLLSRGVLPSMMCPMGVIAKPRKGCHDPESGRSATRRGGIYTYLYTLNVTNSFKFVLQVVAAVRVFKSRNTQSHSCFNLVNEYGQ